MSLKFFYKFLIFFGILVFIVGAVADGQAQLELRHGLKIGPYIYVIGVLIWFFKRFKNPILHKYDLKKYRTDLDAMLYFFFNNFLLEFFGFCGGILMLLLLSNGTFTKSEAYQAALILIKEDQRVIDKIGAFNEAGLLVGGTLSNSHAKLGFSVYGTSGGAEINVVVDKQAQGWIIEFLEIK